MQIDPRGVCDALLTLAMRVCATRLGRDFESVFGKFSPY